MNFQDFQELINYLSNETNWKDSPFTNYRYNSDSKLKANSPLNLYSLITTKKRDGNFNFLNEPKYKLSDYISKLGNVTIDEEYVNDETISHYNIIFHFENHGDEKGIYIKILAWRDSHEEIYIQEYDWKKAVQVWPVDKEIIVFEEVRSGLEE